MAVSLPSSVGKILYGAFFVLALPVLLVLWANATEPTVQVPLRASLPIGLPLAAAGVMLVVLGMAALWIHGKGLPMNLAPPPRFVTQGVFRLLPHPIYAGFCLLSVGASITAGSASGLWLISPVVALGCAALVLGYERHDLRQRFGVALVNPQVVMPPDDDRRPTSLERIRCYLCVLFPWVFLYEAVVSAGVPHDALSAYLPFENNLRVWEWTEFFYASCYVVTALVPLVAVSARDLRRFAVCGLLAMAVVFPLFLLIPLVAVPRPFVPQGDLGQLLAWERALDIPGAAFPSFHVIWALLAAEVFAGRMPALRWVWRAWALLVAASCVTTGMHAIVDVLGGFLIVALVAHATGVWSRIRDWSERICNSWRDWRLGPLRVINHGAYAGLAGFVGVLIAQTLAGPDSAAAVFLAVVAGLLAAGLWAQFIEGSPMLLRPFGYYGGLLGTILGALAAPLTGSSACLLLAAFGVSGPWIQALGRLRCLVQGCCHGRPAHETVGIRYVHPQSRVTRLTQWAGVPIHATPLYSILWNIVTGVALARLWTLHAPLHLIAGLYLILNGLGRFVEEAYRGEPQTPVIARLRVYQWMAIASIVAGALLTALGHGAPAPVPQLSVMSLIPAFAFGAMCWFALGVDFPHANRRFARLV
jgi:membrane-associated phospholipid phosphatase/protein-S-isoprenylcysteine O-methyltransferase Ste14